MMRVEASGCLGPSTTLQQVCVTSVNRCSALSGVGVVCAFAPDGTVYVGLRSDNTVLTANGWHFDQFADPTIVSGDPGATATDAMECARASCAPPCPGVPPPSLPGHCPVDSGVDDGSEAND
jgi:hypothetical protein